MSFVQAFNRKTREYKEPLLVQQHQGAVFEASNSNSLDSEVQPETKNFSFFCNDVTLSYEYINQGRW